MQITSIHTDSCDCHDGEAFFKFLDGAILAYFKERVETDGIKYVERDAEAGEDAPIIGVEAEDQLCQVVISTIILQFLLLNTPIKKQITDPSKATVTKKRKREKKGVSDQVDIQDESNPLPCVIKHEMNFHILQEAARSVLSRTLEFLSNGVVQCDRGIVMGANQDNFMSLVVNTRDPRMISTPTLHNIPTRHTWMDVYRFRENDCVTSRYAWDQEMRGRRNQGVKSFARFQLVPNDKSQSSMRIARWEDNVSLISWTLEQVTGNVGAMNVLLKELRKSFEDLSFILCDVRDTLESENFMEIYEEYLAMFTEYCESSEKHPLLRRQKEAVQNFDYSLVKPVDETSDKYNYSQLCEQKVLEFMMIPYEYDLNNDFLLEQFSTDLKITSFSDKLSRFAREVMAASDTMVSTFNF